MGRKHPNELKLKKQQRMRRAYLKPYAANQVHVPQQIDKTQVPQSAEGIFDYRQRGKGFFDAYWDAVFPGRKSVSQERKIALTRASEERMIDMLADEADSFLTIREGGITKTRLTWMFNRKKTRNFFVETCLHPSGMYIKKSMVYCAEERAMFAFKNNRIEWLEHIPLATQEPDSPSG